MVPWEVPRAGYEAFLVTPKDEGHSKEIIGKLTDPRHKGMCMVMPANLMVDVDFVRNLQTFKQSMFVFTARRPPRSCWVPSSGGRKKS